jgi:hypothetical protein
MNDKINKALISEGLKLGCYSDEIDHINDSTVKKIVQAIKNYDTTDIKTTINKNACYIEVVMIDKEVDLIYLSKNEYHGRYGN